MAEINKYYLTTAISYTNGPPHIGHAYESILADVIARYRKIFGERVYFSTGTDEHGAKIAEKAKNENMSPQEMCDLYSDKFVELNKKLNVQYDKFIRTTSKEHKDVAKSIFDECYKKADIYLDKYTGWYLQREERFMSETEARNCNYTDPISGNPLTMIEQPSYFFRLSKYQNEIIDFIANNDFIQPKERKIEILDRLSDPLHDLSISRIDFDWGIPIDKNM